MYNELIQTLPNIDTNSQFWALQIQVSFHEIEIFSNNILIYQFQYCEGMAKAQNFRSLDHRYIAEVSIAM
jgi:hypothetical protein